MTFPIIPASTVSGSYQISRSLRFRSSASAYLSRTPASAGNRKTWTWSGWVKRGTLATAQWLFDGFQDANNFTAIYLDNTVTDAIVVQNVTAATSTILKKSTQVFRDPAAWYHIVVNCDTTLVSPAVNVWFNNQAVTAWTTNTMTIAQNANTFINATNPHNVGRYSGSANYFDGYLAEVNFIDGQALTPSSFGAFDTNGVWQPAKYTGSYGTNGFYLNFSDNSGATATTIGKDSSGNSNNWTPFNISVSAGVNYDSMIDSPTNYADGGNGRGNYAVLNPNFQGSSSYISRGNLYATGSNPFARATMSVPATGQYYYEVYVTAAAAGGYLYGGSGALYKQDGTRWNGSGWSAYGASYTAGDTIGCAVDTTNNTVTWYKNNASQGQITTNVGLIRDGISDIWGFDGSGTWTLDFNFGQRPFTYTPPSGFSALNTQNLPTPTIAAGNKYFDALLYTGANPNAAKTVTGLGFQPDFVWIKSRVTGYGHGLFDVARGVNKRLQTDTTGAEATSSTYLTAFNSDGFSLGTDYGQNAPSEPYVSWNWKAGGTGVTNTSGSITSTVSANTSAGFSVVTATAPASGSFTIGHGLGVTPGMVIVKPTAGGTANWGVWHQSLGSSYYLNLNQTAAQTSTTYWGTMTSSLISFAATNLVNASSAFVCYAFAPVAGYSAFGSYTGNGSADGPFIYTGFRSRWIMVKRTDSATNNGWLIVDTSRPNYNPVPSERIFANDATVYSQNNIFDILSNGFKNRDNGIDNNASGGTYIYAAFAENPFKISRAR